MMVETNLKFISLFLSFRKSEGGSLGPTEHSKVPEARHPSSSISFPEGSLQWFSCSRQRTGGRGHDGEMSVCQLLFKGGSLKELPSALLSTSHYQNSVRRPTPRARLASAISTLDSHVPGINEGSVNSEEGEMDISDNKSDRDLFCLDVVPSFTELREDASSRAHRLPCL